MNKGEIFHKLKVVIIGAGISGLSAALRLSECGVRDIAVIEAQGVAGGRVKSVKFGDSYVDLGAQWLHGTKSELCQMAEESGLLSEERSFEGLGNYYYGNGQVIPPSVVYEVNDVVADIMSELERLCDEEAPESVGEFMSSRFEEYLDSKEDSSLNEVRRNLFDWHIRFQVIDNSCSNLWKLSSYAFGGYEFVGGEDYINFKSGFQSLVDILVSKLPDGCLFLNSSVKTLRWKETADFPSDNICEILTENGDIFLCDHVIITCSAGYLKNNWSLFQPSLPLEYIKSFNCIGFDPVNKIFLEYQHSWWGNLKGIQFVWNTEERKNTMQDSDALWTCDLTGFDPVVGSPNILVGWVGGEGAKLLENLSYEAIANHCTQLFRDIMSGPEIPLPINCISSSWYSNKYIMGGYSHIKVERDHNKSYLNTLLKPIETSLPHSAKHPSILFSGEALHGKYYSTTHGAYEVGKLQADKLIKYLNVTH